MRPRYESRFDHNKFAMDPRPIIFMDDEGSLLLNKALVDNINESRISHELWLTDEVLSMYFNRFTTSVGADWQGDSVHDGKRVTWSYVERLHDMEEKLTRGIRLDIEDFQNFLWVIDFNRPEINRDGILNMWRGTWPD